MPSAQSPDHKIMLHNPFWARDLGMLFAAKVAHYTPRISHAQEINRSVAN